MHTYIINDTKRDPELAENRRKVENPAAGLVPVLGGLRYRTGQQHGRVRKCARMSLISLEPSSTQQQGDQAVEQVQEKAT